VFTCSGAGLILRSFGSTSQSQLQLNSERPQSAKNYSSQLQHHSPPPPTPTAHQIDPRDLQSAGNSYPSIIRFRDSPFSPYRRLDQDRRIFASVVSISDRVKTLPVSNPSGDYSCPQNNCATYASTIDRMLRINIFSIYKGSD
jgi:hypothetical protein